MIRRRLARTLAALHLALMLSGCWSRVEVNDLAIVSMMALDKTQNGDLELWISVVIPGRAGGAPGEGGSSRGEGRTFVMLRAAGKTVLEAAKQLQAELPRRIFWAHTRVILIGENLAREGLQPALDFLTRHRELRLTNYVLVVKGSPDEVMSAQPDLEKLPVEYVREISRSRVGTVVTLGDWVRDLTAEGAEPTMGVVELSPPPAGAPRNQMAGLKLTGTALFKEDKLVGLVDDDTTKGLLWLRNEMHLGMATVEVPKAPGNISVEWVRTTVNRSAQLEGGKVTIRLQAKVEADVSEEQARLDLSDPKMIGLIEQALDKSIRERMEGALAKMRDLKTDSAGLGEVVHRKLPAAWMRLKKDWGQKGLQQTKVVIEVDARIRRTGLSSKPKGINEQDLIKGEK